MDNEGKPSLRHKTRICVPFQCQMLQTCMAMSKRKTLTYTLPVDNRIVFNMYVFKKKLQLRFTVISSTHAKTITGYISNIRHVASKQVCPPICTHAIIIVFIYFIF